MSIDWEQVKENAQPLKSGYKMSSLSSLLQSPAQADQIDKERKAFEAEVTAGGGDDPLDAWKRYIAWAETTAVNGKLQADRTRLLERCTKKFRSYPQYRDDERYLRVCLKYADCCADPLDVFSFLAEWKIGVGSPLLWAAWALVYEGLRRHDEAKAIYERGVGCMATDEGRDQLRRRQQAFCARLAAGPTEAEMEAQEAEAAAAEAEKGRGALASLRANKKGRVAHNRVAGASKKPAKGLSTTSAAPQGNIAPGRRFAVFTDENGDGPSAPAPAPSSAATTGGGDGMKVWTDLPAERVVTKENRGRAGKWNGKALGGAADSVAAKTFEVFDDGSGAPESSGDEPSARKSLNKRILRRVKDNRVHAVTLKDFARERGHSRQTDAGYLAYDPAPLFSGAEEFCFEELRARSWLANNDIIFEDECAIEVEMDLGMGSVDEQEEQEIMGAPRQTQQQQQQNGFGIFEDTPVDPVPIQARSGFGIFEDGLQETAQAHDSESVLPSRPLTPPPPSDVAAIPAARSMFQGMPSPTINTKQAMADVMAMFGQPIGQEEEEEEEEEEQSKSGEQDQANDEPPRLAAFGIFQDDPSPASSAVSASSISVFDQENAPPAATAAIPQAATGRAAGRAPLGAAMCTQLAEIEKDPEAIKNAVENGTILVDARATPTGFTAQGNSSSGGGSSSSNHGVVSSLSSLSTGSVRMSAPFQGALDLSAFPQGNIDASIVHSTPFTGGLSHVSGPEAANRPTATPIAVPQGKGLASRAPLAPVSALSEATNTTRRSDGGASQYTGTAAGGLSPIFETSRDSATSGASSVLSDTMQSRSVSVSESQMLQGRGEETKVSGSCNGTTVEPLLPADETMMPEALEYPLSLVAIRGQLGTAIEAFRACRGYSASTQPAATLAIGHVWSNVEGWPNVYIQGSTPTGDFLATEVQDTAPPDADDSAIGSTPRTMMVRVQRLPWEFYVLRETHRRLSQHASESPLRRSIASAVFVEERPDGFVTGLERPDDGTLQEVIDMYGRLGKSMEEPLVMFYTIELLRLVEGLHSAGILHGNLRACNLYLRSETEGEWDNLWRPDGAGGWAGRGICATDFAGAVDTHLVPSGTQLCTAEPGRAPYCKVMNLSAWQLQPDYHALANIVHQMLHCVEMELETTNECTWAPREPLRRYWRIELWASLFDALLNEAVLSCARLAEMRAGFENYLVANPYKAKTLKSALARQDIRLFECQ